MSLKSAAINAGKFAIVLGLLAWMIQSGKLDLEQMSIFIKKPQVVLVGVVVWVFGSVLLGTWRWWLLVRAAGLKCTYGRAIKLQMVGFFFNTAMPGAVGGDIVKAIYIVKDQTSLSGKTPALLSVVLDRIVGLIGLFTMGAVAACYHYDSMISSPVTTNLMRGLALVFASSCVFLALVFIPYRDQKDPFERLLAKQIPGFRALLGIYRALRAYREKPAVLFLTIGISIVIQLMFMAYMGYIGQAIYLDGFDTSLLPSIFPFGVLVTAVPLAPGGLGVGHAAFEELFKMVGLPGGANVFNIYTLTQLGLNLMCFIPYLMTKKSGPSNLELDAELINQQ